MGAIAEPDLGYVFYPGQSQFGDERFDVILRREPTHEHFDPEKVRLKVRAHRGVQDLDVQHPWRQPGKSQLCLGHIRVSDRYQKFIDVFSFGGQVQITAVANKTTCIITSPAPLLDLTVEDTNAMLLANEVDIFLAQQRARLNPRFPAEFDSKLAAVDPLSFYTSCLGHLQEKFADSTVYFNPTYQRFKHKLNLEIDRLQLADTWPANMPTLAELLEVRP